MKIFKYISIFICVFSMSSITSVSQNIETDSIRICKQFYNNATSLIKEKKYHQAKQELRNAQKIAPLEKKPKVFNLQGTVCWYMGQYDSALAFYTESLRYSQKIKNRKYEAMAYNNIGFIYAEYDDFEKTLDYYQKALNIREEEGDKIGIAMSYNSLGRVSLSLNDQKKSLEYHNKALELFRELGKVNGESNALNCLGNVYFEQSNFVQALKHYQQSLERRESIQDSILISESLKNISKTLILQKKYPKALAIVNNGIEMAQSIYSDKRLQEFYHQKYEILLALSNYKEALKYYQLATELKEELLSLESKNKIAELNLMFETEKKEQQIYMLYSQHQLAKHQSETRLYLLVLAFLLLFLALLSFILIFRQSKLKASLSLERNKQQLLRSQMNPHFVYNALSAIQNFILENDKLDAVSYISDFSNLMRRVLESSRNELISLEDEIDLIKNYLKLQHLRFGHSFDYHISIDDGMNIETTNLPPMLSQPFIENAIEHGMRSMENNQGKIEVSYKMEHQNLIVRLKDNGPGINSKAINPDHKSLATKITNERIVNIRKSLKLKIQILTKSNKEEGTEITFIIPQKP